MCRLPVYWHTQLCHSCFPSLCLGFVVDNTVWASLSISSFGSCLKTHLFWEVTRNHSVLFWCAAYGSVSRLVQCYFTSTDTVRTIKDGTPCTLRPRTPYGLLRTGRPVLYAHRDRTDCKGRGALYVHLLFHAAPELCSSVLLYVPRNRTDSLGRGTQDGHLDFHAAPELWTHTLLQCCFTSTEAVQTISDGCPGRQTIRDGEPRTSTSTFTQLRSSEHTHFFSFALRPQRPYRPLGTGSPGRPSRLSHSSWALTRWLYLIFGFMGTKWSCDLIECWGCLLPVDVFHGMTVTFEWGGTVCGSRCYVRRNIGWCSL